ncbi:UDP-glucose:Glycoprotein Glucosyltransferase [Cordyceps fumosorosea ARSEF 2679]|uniref:UDP-glucose:Glycoprotein Glucosyltransferase n=1 Tax=Cordyceps fumosorosea (strain ARSEF 2679) TaxID=1081104 RepID=A0A162JTX3_CORFA|nr:UDP-glucose:Glycoprotein Glucosyltransferase [Cordyceps fumosorosea ARSEF 2679]OAA73742.1 UDP-glucose:Glycoprotein Glucosyltransferase [Cordyceps fumosorosea ARSEF 2679]
MASTQGLRLLAAVILTAWQVSASPAINVRMEATFTGGPYLLELLETATAENSSAYFPLLDRIAEGRFSELSTDADLYGEFISVVREDGHISSPEALSTFNLGLSLRSSTPRVEAHYQYYDTAVALADIDPSCDSWILLDGNQYCTPDLQKAARTGLFDSKISILPFDRSVGSGADAVLYADPASPNFGKFHRRLERAARAGELSYRVRYRRPINSDHKPLPVSGFGVELALKRTDYIVIDDRVSQNDGTQKPLNTEAMFEDQELTDIRPLSTSELEALGVKSSSFIQSSNAPFETLVKLMQDFPKFSASVSAHNVSTSFSEEYERGHIQRVPRGVNALWMNGLQLIERQIEPFALVEMLRRERKFIDVLRKLGLSGAEAISLLGHDKVAESKSDAGDAIRYDWTDRSEEGNAIAWLNDLESDARYAQYPDELSSLLQRTFPGQIPPIARDVFNVVFALDLSDRDDLALLGQMLALVGRGIPIRFGIVPATSTPEALQHAKLLYHLMGTYGFDSLQNYIEGLGEEPDPALASTSFSRVVDDPMLAAGTESRGFLDVIETEELDTQAEMAAQWITRLKAMDKSAPIFFVNGASTPRTANWLQSMSMQVSEDLQTIQKGVYHGVIGDDMWVPEIFLEGALNRRNEYISVDDAHPLRILDASKLYGDHKDMFDIIPVQKNDPKAEREAWAAVAVIADATTSHGAKLIKSALEFRRSNSGVQLELIHNPTTTDGASDVNEALKDASDLFSLRTVDEIEKIVRETKAGSSTNAYDIALKRFLLYANVQPGNSGVLVNGRLVGPIAPDDDLLPADFTQLLGLERKHRILPIFEALDDLGLGNKISDPISASKLMSITALSTISDLPEGIFETSSSTRSMIYKKWDAKHTTIEVGDEATASIHLVALLNPLSEQAQRWAPLLKILSELDGVYLKLFLNPKEKLEELPIKRFFRYVLEPKPSFDEDGAIQGGQATFNGLPSEALLTLGMIVPPAWLVAAKESIHDLDNIKLSSVNSNVDATYELEHILIQGHSREGKSSPPRGAQLVLGTEKEPHLTDTIVMANLGFFQFQANPGIYAIQLKEGRSADIFEIESVGAQGWTAVPGDEGTSLALLDFQGTTLYPRLSRKPGMEEVDVLEEGGGAADGFVSKGFKLAEGFLGNALGKKSASDLEHAEINIFSVASGHLYERMLNIMMVSVMRHTKHTVKFWFIEQFLSPSFKEFIPHLAEEYGFKYEMVTYKWPHWLRHQKEKQREIWGYKILFLDVLFPLSVDKVIFVDADQIVRTDMMDLVKLDLDGAPYGFTPMCDSRTEMEGFRFWKQGYWANYLRGRPYHISALYVVDLRRFREIAAGDRLRQQYQALSADPNSLANLDQDLPNHMQFQLPIHSLPQEWLWCETWCSDESQSKARTIDLCNNPETKEPKLDRARRQVPEWTEYDDEIVALAKRVKAAKNPSESEHQAEPERNTKSRNFEEEPVRTKDEL